MSDILEAIEWARNTIKDRLKFGLDDLNAARSRERRASGVLISCKHEIIRLQGQVGILKECVEYVKASHVCICPQKDSECASGLICSHCACVEALEILKALELENQE